jgi:hypothetical protein
MTDTTPQEHILSVLKRLPVLEERRPDIEGLAFMINANYVFGGVNDIPRMRSGGTKKAERKLAELRDSLIAVARCIHSMPIEAHDALHVEVKAAYQRQKANEAKGSWRQSDRVFGPLIFDTFAIALAEATEKARLTIAATPNPINGRKPKKVAAGWVAWRAVEAFEHLTGKPATIVTDIGHGHAAGGPFLKFLSELFEVLETNASPEAHGRAAIKEERGRKKRAKAPLDKA